MAQFEVILYEKNDHVAWITLNRPEVLNALNEKLRDELALALEQAKDDDDVYLLVITGAGDKAFCAGADIKMLTTRTPTDAIKHGFKRTKRPYELIRDLPKPVIGMVNGYAFGGGCELAMFCDIIIASSNAQFGQLETSVGVIPGGGGSQILPRLVGEKKAKELIFTAKRISAEEALNLGLVNRVVPKDQLKGAVEELTANLKKKSPLILGLAKMAINKSFELPLSAGMAYEANLFALCFGTEDQKEGARAFLEKRAPDYKGK